MSSWICACGNTLLIPSGQQGNHLYIVLNDPMDFNGHPPQSCASVCICTIRLGPYDKTCVVAPGEHKFVVDPSYVAYRHTRIDQASHLIGMVTANAVFPHDPVSNELLTRVRLGLRESKQTPNYLKQLPIP